MWEVGDKAVCIDDSPAKDNPSIPGTPLILKKVYTVTKVGISDGIVTKGSVCLRIDDGTSLGTFWTASRFRKVIKDKEEKCEEEFVTLLNRSKVRKEEHV